MDIPGLRPEPTSLQAEPIFPNDLEDMVTFSFRDPEWCIHQKNDRCFLEAPHKFEDCGLYE